MRPSLTPHPMSLRQRISQALAANALGQGVTIGSQLLLTPLFFQAWGSARYGEWLMLSSLPAYLAMADLGIGSAASNEMTMQAAAGKHREAQQTFLGAWRVLWLASALILLAGLGLAWWFGWRRPDLSSHQISGADTAWVLIGLTLSVVVSLMHGIVFAGFRCAERNALGLMLGNLTRMAEAMVMGGLLWAGHGPVALAWGALIVKTLLLVGQYLGLRQMAPWLFTPGVRADPHLVKRLIRPSIGFLALPMGHALAIQGPVLVIGTVLGPSAAAVFSALRTLARLPVQLTNVFNNAVWPEMSRAHGAGDVSLLRTLHRGTWGSSLVLTVLAGVGLIALGPWVASAWLGKDIAHDPALLAALVGITTLTSIWSASYIVLAAINEHARMGLGYVAINAGMLGLMWLAGQFAGWQGVLWPMVMAELAMLGWVMPQTMRHTQDRLDLFVRSATVEGWHRLYQRLRAS
jgi:O-antigen/teichoic acid export membrane protein